jgi:Protein of unknown function (DUF3105)
MADPKKETKRERREVAKQRRLEEIRRRQRKARSRKILAFSLGGLAVAGLVVGIIAAQAASNRNKVSLANVARAGGCEAIKTFPDEGNSHQPPYSYKTNPPTSGNHDPQTANTGILPSSPGDQHLVHNMEHGHVVIWYHTDLDPSLVTALQNVVKIDPTRTIMVPRDNMDVPLAFTAWTKMQRCPSPTTSKTPEVAKRFVATFKGKGPEGDKPQVPVGV